MAEALKGVEAGSDAEDAFGFGDLFQQGGGFGEIEASGAGLGADEVGEPGEDHIKVAVAGIEVIGLGGCLVEILTLLQPCAIGAVAVGGDLLLGGSLSGGLDLFPFLGEEIGEHGFHMERGDGVAEPSCGGLVERCDEFVPAVRPERATAGEFHLHAAGKDGRQKPLRARGQEQEEGAVRGFFEGFEKSVLSLFVHAVGVHDHADLGHALGCGEMEGVFKVAYFGDGNAA